MKLFKKLFSSKKEEGLPSKDEVMSKADAWRKETEAILGETTSLADEVSEVSPEEKAWVAWFLRLPENHKMIVQKWGQKGIKATPENFDAILQHIEEAKSH